MKKSEANCEMELQQPKECVMVVGSTGTGKSSTINLYTGCEPPQKTSSESDPVQQKIEMVTDYNHSAAPPWIDNPGWSDRTKADSDIFKNMLRYLQNNNITFIKAIIWNIKISNRFDEELDSQANFINKFADSQIWTNVIIISKGHLNDNDCLGAVTAAKNCYKGANPLCLSYKFASQEDVEEMSERIRHKNRLFTNEEIKKKLEDIIAELTPIPIKFINKKCLDCGQECDERLMEDICHREKVRGHKGKLKQKFSKISAGASTGAGVVAVAGLATTLIVLSPESLGVLALSPLLMAPGAYVCGHRALSGGVRPSPGVESVAGSCLPVLEYSCCKKKDQEGGGCIDVCDKCNVEWGEKVGKEGCIFIKQQEKVKQENNYEVFKKEHALVDA